MNDITPRFSPSYPLIEKAYFFYELREILINPDSANSKRLFKNLTNSQLLGKPLYLRVTLVKSNKIKCAVPTSESITLCNLTEMVFYVSNSLSV